MREINFYPEESAGGISLVLEEVDGVSGGPEAWAGERDERGDEGDFMVFCELVLDQWGLKAYKSARGGVGRLRFIVDFKRLPRANPVCPEAQRCSSISSIPPPRSGILPRRFSHACTPASFRDQFASQSERAES